MNVKSKIGIGATLSAAFLLTRPGLTWAQDANSRTVEQYTCKDVMREHGDNRDVTIAFLHGYLLGRSGQSMFNIDNLHKQTSAFIEHCLDNPNEHAVDAMSKIKG
jgi:HdeA/HdeB family